MSAARTPDPGQQRLCIVVTFNWLTELQAKVPR